MHRIILIIAIGVLVLYLIRRFRLLSPEKQQKVLKIIMFTGLAVLLALLALSGRLNWLIAALGAVVPLIPRMLRFLATAWPTILPFLKRYQQNKQSNMHSGYIRLQIDMLNGELQGEVLQGQYKGSKLQQMSLEQLKSLLEECREADREAAALLVAYLDRTHAGWSAEKTDFHDFSSAGMSEQQARDVLGVSNTATKAEIIKAHKVLMQRLHPDRGGSDYLAKQINRAKDVLLSLL